jgi:hypothetical protein
LLRMAVSGGSERGRREDGDYGGSAHSQRSREMRVRSTCIASPIK